MGIKKIFCISKAEGDHENPYVAISDLKWLDLGTFSMGKFTRLEMYDWVENGGYAYVEGKSGSKAKLITAVSPQGTKYVKTEANETEADSLLSLEECKP